MKQLAKAIVALVLMFLSDVPAMASRPVVVGKISDATIREASGFVRSRQYQGVFWILSDSGNPANLYAIQRTGQVMARYRLTGVLNFDWETLAADDRGNLYIGDVGNNFRANIRQVLRVREPDLNADLRRHPDSTVLRPLKYDAQFQYSFPDEPLDIEASFIRNQRLYLINKTRFGAADLFELPLSKEIRHRQIQLVTRLVNLPYVTGVAMSPDGLKLAVVTYSQVVVFKLRKQQPIAELSSQELQRAIFKADSIESASFVDDRELLLLGEDGKLHSLTVDTE